MNDGALSGRERAVRVLLWVLAFLVPALAVGRPLPHGPYGLVPALAVTDGVRIRRVLIWTLLVLAYEYWYGLRPGTLALSVPVLSAVHAVVARFIRVGTGSRASSGSVPVRLLLAALWASGMVGFSVLWLGLPGMPAPAAPWWALWRVNGVIVLAMCAASVIMLQASRAGRARRERGGLL
ncbi:MAG TPA: hypothetical protein VD862_01070 [Candidatus Paceibacterota bacterium]|nr:hypothetical protein [Candidatus Paceibacterota bacterium]